MLGREDSTPDPAPSSRLPIVLWSGLGIGLALLGLGSLGALAGPGALPTSVVDVRCLPTGLASFDPAAVLTLGILVLLVTPAAAVAHLAVAWLRAGDRPHGAVATGVLAIIVGSAVAAWLSGAAAAPGSQPSLSAGVETEVLAVSLAAGVLGSMLGLGGGVFIVPVLSVFLGVPLKATIAASAVSVVVNSLGGTAVYLAGA